MLVLLSFVVAAIEGFKAAMGEKKRSYGGAGPFSDGWRPALVLVFVGGGGKGRRGTTDDGGGGITGFVVGFRARRVNL